MSENIQSAKRTHDGISTNLWQIQRQTGKLLPDLHLKSGEVQRVKEQPIKSTSAMDIYEGLYLGNEKVYIKCLRVVEANENSLRVSRLFLSCPLLNNDYVSVSKGR